MNRLVVTLLLLSGLSGCVTVPKNHFTTPLSVELGNNLAVDAIKQLQSLYPPAHTTFNLGQPVPKTDSFGTSLVLKMHEQGYAVQTVDHAPSTQTVTGLSIHYTVDKPASSVFAGLYRVQLNVGKTILTRAYTAKNNTTVPAGAWAIME
jgi:hypothetical protein